MDKKFSEDLKKILKTVIAADVDFYRKKYAQAGLDISESWIEELTEEKFKLLPITTKKEVALAPYRSRLYEEKSGLNKLINCEEAGRYFLIHRTLEEIRRDDLPFAGERPMVLLNDVYEAIERCLFFYEKNMLPLIGEVYNPAVVTATARQYNVDTMFIDHASIVSFRDALLKLNLPLKSVTVIDPAFEKNDFEWPENVKLNFVLSVPETGRIAYACPEATAEKKFIFHPYDDVHIEPGLAVVTSARLKACPMIRYRSSLFLEEVESKCACNKPALKLL
ncbi:MAG: hypothetical protein HY456_00520 [Parcubacteria group bacterium]|nr:hypothetical protein [Parcubacteria group bacterium]